MSVFLKNLFPWVILRNFIFPALSSFLGFRPDHDTRWDASSNDDISVPNSAITDVADLRLIPGTVCRFFICSGNHRLHNSSILSRHSLRCFCARVTSSLIYRMTSMSVCEITPVSDAVMTSFPTRFKIRPWMRPTNTLGSVIPSDIFSTTF